MFLTINDIKTIAQEMKLKLGIDYPGFSMSFFRRRLNYVFEAMNIHRIQDFNSMFASIVKVDEIAHYMSVPCTEMFRDPGFWRRLKKYLSGRNNLRIWIPNLSNCYELFSLVVILHQIGNKDYKIVANCISEKTEKTIVALKVPSKDDQVNRSNFERLETPDDSYENYFVKKDDGKVYIKPELLKNVEFRVGWFMNREVETFDFVLVRNVLVDYAMPLYEKAAQRLCQSVGEGGLLALGVKERFAVKIPSITLVDETESIYGRNFKG